MSLKPGSMPSVGATAGGQINLNTKLFTEGSSRSLYIQEARIIREGKRIEGISECRKRD